MTDLHEAPRASFTDMSTSTKEDWMVIMGQRIELEQALPDRIIEQFDHLRDDYGGFPVDRLEHSLQTATRAERDGRDDEYVLCALIHDIGDPLTPYNHPDVAAAILKPFVSEANLWMVANHGAFQGYYFFHHIGLDRNLREHFKDSPHYEYCAQFCHLYDQAAFDPDYESEPLEFFIPMVERVFSKPVNSMYLKAMQE